jgi:uncharacterized protein YprB with RNaseH-like and TPR domain
MDDDDKLLRRFARSFGIDGEIPDEPEVVPDEPTTEADSRPGTLEETPYGHLRVIRRRLTTAYPYSTRPIEHLLTPATTGHSRYLKDPRLTGFNREEALFLDTETTGLSHGAGTVAFLIGLGWFEGDEYILEQLLLDDYDQEQAQLHRLLERLEGKRYLVSYNGKSFDRSVLENRLVIHRFMSHKEAHLRLMPHLDLLHVGRRIYSGLLENHRLGTLEEEILGFHRPDDIPGELVPQYFFRYLLSGIGEHIEGVLKHNFDDVLSLLHLADELLTRIDPDTLPEDPTIAINVGRLFADSDHTDEAIRFLEHGLGLHAPASGLQPPASPSSLQPPASSLRPAAKLLARLYRKAKRPWQDLVRLWQTVQTASPSVDALTELAKLAERSEKDLRKALALVDQALALTPDDEALLSRRQRLVKRLGPS